jgi:RNA polymerase sigma factor (sigma-70 family)
LAFPVQSQSFLLYGQDNNLLNAYMMQKNSSQTVENTGDDLSHDDMIVAIAQNQDKDAFITLFEYFAPRLKSFLMRGGTNPDLADELAQETMLSVWQKAKSFNPQRASASTWIFTIARNKRIDAFRKAKRPEPDIDKFELADTNTVMPDVQISNDEDALALTEALKNLPEDQAALIRKSYFEEKTHMAIAEEENIPLGTVKSRIRLALEKLRHHLGGLNA